MKVCEQLYVDKLPKVIEEVIREKAQGNPFYAGEICNALIESKQLLIKNGKCVVSADKLDFNKIPETVQGLITNRIDSLSPSSQLVLKVASVIGRNFQYDILLDVFPVEDTKPFLRQYISTLTNASLIAKLHSHDTYTFKHSSIVDCCYNMLLPSQKQQLHKVIMFRIHS